MKEAGHVRLVPVPCSVTRAREVVDAWHRHHGSSTSALYACAVATEDGTVRILPVSAGEKPAPVPSPRELRARLRGIERDLRVIRDPWLRRELLEQRRVVKGALTTHALHGRR